MMTIAITLNLERALAITMHMAKFVKLVAPLTAFLVFVLREDGRAMAALRRGAPKCEPVTRTKVTSVGHSRWDSTTYDKLV